MISAAPPSAVMDAEAMVRAAAWDQVSPGELSFDFSPGPAASKRRALRSRRGGAKASGIKEAIIRWLDEQL